jgi:uncharacterized protein (TIGR02231 family)
MEKVIDVVEREATLETGGYQAIFRLPGRVSVAADEGAKSFRIAAATIVPELLVRATPALDATAFLEAGFKHGEDAPLLPGRVAIYRDGIFVGRGQMPLTAKEQPVRLGFGADDKVKVERIVRARARPGSSRPRRPTSAISRSRCATATTPRSAWPSRISCR